MYIISLILQGRYGKGNGQEYLKEYMVEYRRPGLSKWKLYKDKDGNKVNMFDMAF